MPLGAPETDESELIAVETPVTGGSTASTAGTPSYAALAAADDDAPMADEEDLAPSAVKAELQIKRGAEVRPAPPAKKSNSPAAERAVRKG